MVTKKSEDKIKSIAFDMREGGKKLQRHFGLEGKANKIVYSNDLDRPHGDRGIGLLIWM